MSATLVSACSLLNAPDDVVPAGGPGVGGGGGSSACSAASDCDDGNPCNGVEQCESGACVHGAPPSLDDGNPCTNDSCDSAKGVVHEPVNIDDQDACTTDACDPKTGRITHEPINVDDGDVCTVDACDPMTGPTHTPINGIDDGNGCTQDICDPSTGRITHMVVEGCACTHSLCAFGGSGLDQNACSWGDVNCIDKVCAQIPTCCATQGGVWDAFCRTLVEDPDTCGFDCKCDHSYCVQGTMLLATCDPCVARVCELNPSCCAAQWDATCVSLTSTACNVPSGSCN